MDWLQNRKESFRNSILRDLTPDLSRYVANGKTESDRAARAAQVKNTVTPALIATIDENGENLVFNKAAAYVNQGQTEQDRLARIEALLPSMEKGLAKLADNLIQIIRESRIPKEAQQTVNYAATIETNTTRVFARYDFSAGGINKQAVLEEIRIAAIQQALSQGGDEDDFNAAWYESNKGLSGRFDAALQVPKKSDITDMQPVTEVALVEHSNGIKSLPHPPSDSIYIVYAKDGFVIKYPNSRWSESVTKGYHGVIKPAFQSATQLANLAADPSIKKSGKRIYNKFNTNKKYSTFSDDYNSDTPCNISYDRVFVASRRVSEEVKGGLSGVQIYEFGSYVEPLEAMPFFGEYEVGSAPAVATVAVAENTNIREARFHNPFMDLKGGERTDTAQKYIENFEKAKKVKMSAYQKDFAMWLLTGTGNAFVEAVAGSGKSTTLLWCAELIQDFGGRQVILSFNRPIADKNNEALEASRARMRARGFHQFGYGGYLDLDSDMLLSSEDRKKKRPKNYIQFGLGEFLQSNNFEMRGSKYDDLIEKRVAEILGVDVAKLRSLVDQQMTPPAERKIAQDTLTQYNSFVDSSKTAFMITTSTLVDLNDPELVGKTLDYYAIDLGGRPVTDIIKVVRNVLERGYEMMTRERVVSFIDMIHWQAIGVIPMPRMDIIFVDEAQDMSSENISFIKNLAARGARLVFVGDRAQAIYGWRGADTTAVDNIVREFNCSLLPLSICYRCPVKIVEFAQEEVPQIQYRPGAPDGEIVYTDDKEFEAYINSAEPPKPGDLLLCRMNAPLSRIIMKILKRRIPAVILGDKYMAYGILTALRDAAKFSENFDFVNDYAKSLDGYLEQRMNQIREKSRNETSSQKKIDDIADYVEFLKNVYLGLKELGTPARTPLELQLFIFGSTRMSTKDVESVKKDGYEQYPRAIIFTPKEGERPPDSLRKEYVVGSSIHRAKGDEADNVFWFGPNEYDLRKNVKYDQDGNPITLKEWQIIEEKNLCYVAKTRAKKRLVMIADTRKAASNALAAVAAAAAKKVRGGGDDAGDDFESQDIEDALKDPNLTVTHAGNFSTSPLSEFLSLKPPTREQNPRHYRTPNRSLIDIPSLVEKGRRLPAPSAGVIEFAIMAISDQDATNIVQFNNSIPLLSAFIYLLDRRFISMDERGTVRLTSAGNAVIRKMDQEEVDNFLGTDLV